MSSVAIPSREADRAVLYAAIAVALVTVIRVLYLAGERFPLYGDEAQYWAWSTELDWGYYSKPPMIAWLIRATTSLVGVREMGVRLSAPLLHAGTAMLLLAIGTRLFNARVGAWTAVVYATLPAVSLASMVMSTDTPLLFFWALALLCYLRALEEDRWADWLGMGAAIGFGLLSKYAMGFFVLSIGLHLLSSAEGRRRLASPKLWAGLAVGFMILAPNLIWNLNNGAVTFKHTGDNANLAGPLFHPAKLGDFLGGQFGVFGPILFAFLLILVLGHAKTVWRDDRQRLLVCFILPHFLPIMVIALLSRANANWAAAIYIAATPLVVAWALDSALRRKLLIASVALHVMVAGLAYHLHGLANLTGVALTRKTDPYNRVLGFDQAGFAVAHLLRQMPGAVLMTEDRMLFALMAFYVQPRPIQVQWNGNGRIDEHFKMTTDIRDHAKAPILFVTERENPVDVTSRFELADFFAKIQIPIYAEDERVFFTFELQGLKN
jgi:4-amino-4-deoxy-L-arabinose transferase-like glycosyltransferase